MNLGSISWIQSSGSGRRLPQFGVRRPTPTEPRMLPMTKLVDVGSLASYFESLSDPRHTRNRKHLLVDIAVIAVCGIVCGCDGPTAIHRWAKHRASWLAQHLTLPNGIPSRDCIRRLLVALKPEAFQRCFQAWVGDATETKSNEITAIPQLLEQIDLDGTLITIDAMGCQKEIVERVVTGGGDCVIAVKDNQPKLLAAIQAFFLGHLERDLEGLRYRYHETLDDGRGRVDERSYYLAKVPRDFAPARDWPWVKAIGYSVRITRQADGTESDEVRYYLSSRYLSGKRFGEAVRGHWGIEAMHWVLDVNFREDEHRTRERTLGNNLSWLRRLPVA